MDIKTKQIYSEVYEILLLLGDNFINRLPKELFELIKSEKLESYNLQYNMYGLLDKQKIQKQSRAMLALFYLNYWCESEEEKGKLKKIFIENEKKFQKELREEYNVDNIFKKKENTMREKNNFCFELKKEKKFFRVVKFIKDLFVKSKNIVLFSEK